MPRPPKPPSYLYHKATGQARCVIAGKTHYLGAYGSPESHEKYRRLLAEHRVSVPQATPASSGPKSIEDLICLFLVHADRRYRRADGSPTTEKKNFRDAAAPLLHLYRSSPAGEFGPLALKATRDLMICGWTETLADGSTFAHRPLTRKNINRMVNRLKGLFRWAESEELVPGGTYHRLATVRGLARGEGGVRESAPVLPVPEADLQATLAILNPVVKAMVEVQLLTAMRPGELVRLTPDDLLRTDQVVLPGGLVLPTRGLWVWLPGEHKTAHRGHSKVILFGPKAQEILRPFLEGREGDRPIFSPREAVDAFRALQHAKAVRPASKSRAKKRPRRKPGDRWSALGYNNAIRGAIRRFNRRMAKEGRPERIGHWHVHALRHNAATKLAEQFGIETARIVLGHRSINVTQIYALDDLAKAVDAIRQVG